MTQQPTNSHQKENQRVQDLLNIAYALYQAALHEENPERLEMLRLVALKLLGAISEAINTDKVLDSDIGLELLLFIKLKRNDNPGTETYRRRVADAFEELGWIAQAHE